ncbi:surface antigen-domain-containing protein [Gigaspora rosea]|uniref:Surface antigen-domain-containing protein n=1 Tax=Gigaspora rosea TaxID=44941 RepID=A0A397UGF6_9GLOM|nr:surface antigen-domain-containing protein [Gigaspora rosea]
MTMHLALRGIPSATVPPDAYDHGCDAGWMSSDPKCSVTGERVVSEQESTSEEQFIWFSTTLIKGNEEAQKHVKKYLNMKIDEEEIDISHVCIGEMKLFVETDKVGDEFESFNDEMNRCVIMKFWMMKMSQMTINKKDKTEFLTKCVFRDVICRLRNTRSFPFYIHSFRINGTKRARQALLESVIYDALQARTLGTIIDEVRVAADKLFRLDIFQYVDVFLNSSNDPRTLDVILSVEEKSRFWIKTGTEIAKPINGNPDSRVDISAFSLTKNNQIYSSHDEIMRGIALKWREFAGLGGDVNFIKNEIESQANFPLGKGFIFSASLRNGFLYTLNGQQSKISDRFFLGGAQSIRGFKLNGIGPREEKKDSLGGDLYIAGGVSPFTPLPKLSNYPVKGHLFLNGAVCSNESIFVRGELIGAHNVTLLSFGIIRLLLAQRILSSIFSLTRAPSVSAGVGIAYRSSILRLEVNFCLPLVATTSDKLKKGLQLGLGFNF